MKFEDIVIGTTVTRNCNTCGRFCKLLPWNRDGRLDSFVHYDNEKIDVVIGKKAVNEYITTKCPISSVERWTND